MAPSLSICSLSLVCCQKVFIQHSAALQEKCYLHICIFEFAHRENKVSDLLLGCHLLGPPNIAHYKIDILLLKVEHGGIIRINCAYLLII